MMERCLSITNEQASDEVDTVTQCSGDAEDGGIASALNDQGSYLGQVILSSGGGGFLRQRWKRRVVETSSGSRCLVAKSCLTLFDAMDCSMPGFPVTHYLPKFAQTHVHWVGDAIQSSHPLSSPSPPALNLSQDQGLFQWVSSSHQLAKVLELQLQHQSFLWIFRIDFL